MMNKLDLLESLQNKVGDCQKCELCETRTRLVFGEAHGKMEYMFIGEAPGADEDAAGLPFVGRSGKLLRSKIIEPLGLNTNCYITNTLLCRPPNNANPTPEQTEACKTRLDLAIRIIQPKLIIAVGRYAAIWLSEFKYKDFTMGELVGLEYFYKTEIPVIPIYHPAYLLRQRSKIADMVNLIKERINKV